MEKKAAAPTVRLKASLRKKLKKLPRQEGRSVANYLEQLIKGEIERHEPENKDRRFSVGAGNNRCQEAGAEPASAKSPSANPGRERRNHSDYKQVFRDNRW